MKTTIALIADAANLTADGKLNILGEFNIIWSSAVPLAWPRLFLVLKLEKEPGDPVEFVLTVTIVDPDARPVMTPIRGSVNFGPPSPDGVPASGPIVFDIRNAYFPSYGHYAFEVRAGDSPFISIPLYVMRRQAPATPHP
jgi:hypothetical protein